MAVPAQLEAGPSPRAQCLAHGQLLPIGPPGKSHLCCHRWFRREENLSIQEFGSKPLIFPLQVAPSVNLSTVHLVHREDTDPAHSHLEWRPSPPAGSQRCPAGSWELRYYTFFSGEEQRLHAHGGKDGVWKRENTWVKCFFAFCPSGSQMLEG